MLVSVGQAHAVKKSGSKSNASQSATPAVSESEDVGAAKALDEKYDVSAVMACARGADDYLRSVAKYDFKWDELGWLEVKFDRYLNRLKGPGILTMVSDKLKLQNGFGAYVRVQLLCDFDTEKSKVVGYSVRDK